MGSKKVKIKKENKVPKLYALSELAERKTNAGKNMGVKNIFQKQTESFKRFKQTKGFKEGRKGRQT